MNASLHSSSSMKLIEMVVTITVFSVIARRVRWIFNIEFSVVTQQIWREKNIKDTQENLNKTLGNHIQLKIRCVQVGILKLD